VSRASRSGNHLSLVTLTLTPAEGTPMGRLGKSVGTLKFGDDVAAAALGVDVGAWLASAAR
jgi:hypothetical protein